jgi:hypothetical protein
MHTQPYTNAQTVGSLRKQAIIVLEAARKAPTVEDRDHSLHDAVRLIDLAHSIERDGKAPDWLAFLACRTV